MAVDVQELLKSVKESVGYQEPKRDLAEFDQNAIVLQLQELSQEEVRGYKDFGLLSKKLDTLLIAGREVFKDKDIEDFEQAVEIVRNQKRKESGQSAASSLLQSGLGALANIADGAALANAFFSSSPILSLAYGGVKSGIGSFMEGRQNRAGSMQDFEESLFKDEDESPETPRDSQEAVRPIVGGQVAPLASGGASEDSQAAVGLAVDRLAPELKSAVEDVQAGVELAVDLLDQINDKIGTDSVSSNIIQTNEKIGAGQISGQSALGTDSVSSNGSDIKKLLEDILAATELQLETQDSIRNKQNVSDSIRAQNSFDDIESQRESKDIQGDILAANELQLELLDAIYRKMDDLKGGDGIVDDLLAMSMFGRFSKMAGGLGRGAKSTAKRAAGGLGKAASTTARAAGSTLKFAGAGSMLRGVPVIGSLISAADVGYDAYQESKDGGTISNKTKGRGVGMLIGGALGTLIPIPGVGTALGALAGDWIGGKIGSMFDSDMQDSISAGVTEGQRKSDVDDQLVQRSRSPFTSEQYTNMDEFTMDMQSLAANRAQPQVVQYNQSNTKTSQAPAMPQRIPDPKAKDDTLQNTFNSINGF